MLNRNRWTLVVSLLLAGSMPVGAALAQTSLGTPTLKYTPFAPARMIPLRERRVGSATSDMRATNTIAPRTGPTQSITTSGAGCISMSSMAQSYKR